MQSSFEAFREIYIVSLQNSKAFICRATINSIPVSGYIKKRVANSKEDHVCIISQHSQFRTKGQFDILLNKGEGAKLEWVQWEKLIPFDSINGAVTTLNGASRVRLSAFNVTILHKVV